MMKTYTFHVVGMHCKSCVFMTENELQDLPHVEKAKTSLEKHSVEVTGNFGEKTPEEIAEELSIPLRAQGYELTVEKIAKKASWSEFRFALPIALVFIASMLGVFAEIA